MRFSGFQSDRANLITLALFWLAMIFIVNPIGDFPINDDWVYALSVRSLLGDGIYRIPSFASANVGPQVYWGALFCLPFGFSFTALRISTLIFGFAGIVGVYYLFLQIWHRRRIALIAAAVLLVNPIYFALANTFMTDVPFLALAVVSMALIVRGLGSGHRGVLVAGLVLCLVCVLVRQFALVILGGFACAYLVKHEARRATFAKALLPLIAGIALHLGFNRWLIDSGRKPFAPGIANIAPVSVIDLGYSSAHELFVAIHYLGWFLLPLALICLCSNSSPKKSGAVRWPALVAAGAALGMAAVLIVEHRMMPLGDNTLAYFGIGPLMLRDTLLLGEHLPEATSGLSAWWLGVTGLSVVGAALVILGLARGSARLYALRRSPDIRGAVWMPTFFAVTAVGYLAILLLIAERHSLFDRYLLFLAIIVALVLPLLGIDATRDSSSVRLIRIAGSIAGLALLASATFSVVATHDHLAWQRTRWIALRELVDAGHVSPHRIDGGYEFNGWTLYDARYQVHDAKSWWWVDDDQYLLSAGPMPGYRVVRRLTVDRWWKGTAPDVFVLVRDESSTSQAIRSKQAPSAVAR